MKRKKIPEQLAAKVLFLSERTCCICRLRGKPIQIHHIDMDRNNNDIGNLAVLCLNCHSDAHSDSGLGRKLGQEEIRLYKEDWLKTVSTRRSRFMNERAEPKSEEQLDLFETVDEINDLHGHSEGLDNTRSMTLLAYIKTLLDSQNAVRNVAKVWWDTGITSTMLQGNSELSTFYEGVMNVLASYYPRDHFIDKPSEEYFSDLIASRYSWYYFVDHADPGFPGVYAPLIVGGRVNDELQKMIKDMVEALAITFDLEKKFDLLGWSEKWLVA